MTAAVGTLYSGGSRLHFSAVAFMAATPFRAIHGRMKSAFVPRQVLREYIHSVHVCRWPNRVPGKGMLPVQATSS